LKRYTKTFALIVTGVVFELLDGGCGSPLVRHSSILGDVRNIRQWKVKWVGQTDENSLLYRATVGDLKGKSKYTVEEYCLKYVDDVKEELAGVYGYSFEENFPAVGEITIALRGEKLPDWVPSTDTTFRDIYKGGSQAKQPFSVTPELGTAAAVVSLLMPRDRVREVRVTLSDHTGKVLGEIFLGGDSDDNVKPAFVASVIHKVLTSGRFR
jgi:hypothetical protein